MAQNYWILATGLVLIIEGIGPMLFPNKWRGMIQQIAEMDTNGLRRFGGVLVVSGACILFIFS
ncbi:DUF2065 domain-containing protein [Paraferrimonas haliotis]|uniref:DUF2065 domain-containing protein n=1 Tax=Paraferrimonas haliotis TaxID=2013866 RepID=A0AA37TUY1_9GAMM|nr:DUF2065 domain-containing protein [Paraferrimonas haliotis]GLS83304.1 hypothetical protein GCM10007894_12810 [Paraferrimonas haliotis]